MTTSSSVELINFSNFSAANIDTWISLCQEQGLTEFTLRIPAYSEFSSETLSNAYKNAALAIIADAYAAGIDVNVDLHTWYTTWDSYFDDSGSNVVANREHMYAYIEDCISKLDVDGVASFMVLNEPQAQTASANENSFILNCIATAHAATAKPVSVRFMEGYSPSTGHYSSTINTECDFLCRNTYWDPRYPSTTVYGSTEAKIQQDIADATALSKELWITEFGKSKSNLENQRAYVAAWVAYANTNGIDKIFCWAAQPSVSGETYNIFSSFSPYPAWYELENTIPPAPSDTNLTPIFQDGTGADDGCQWGQYDGTNIYYGDLVPEHQISFRDDVETYSGHSSIRLEDPNEYNPYREVNNNWQTVKPGDHIILRAYIKTAEAEGNAAILGFDAYGPTHRILEIHPCEPQEDIWDIVNGVPTQGGTPTYVEYGEDWTLLTLDVTIPATVYSYDDFGSPITPQQIAGIIPWVGGVWNGRESYPDIWFADAELYINPTETPPDTVNITASSDANSTIAPTGVVAVAYGSNKTFTYTADEGYVVDSVSVDSSAVGITGSYTFLNVVNTHTIAVTAASGSPPSVNIKAIMALRNLNGE